MVPSSTGHGYFMVASDGGVFAFGDAQFEGSCPGIGGCAGTAVAVMPDHTGKGYWLVTNTGAVYAFGDAPFYGAPPQSRCPWSTPWPRRTGTATGSSTPTASSSTSATPPTWGPGRVRQLVQPGHRHLPDGRRPGLLGGLGQGRRLLLRRRALPGEHGGSRHSTATSSPASASRLGGLRPRAPRPRARERGDGRRDDRLHAAARRGRRPAQETADVADQVEHVGAGASARPGGPARSPGPGRRPQGWPGASRRAAPGPPRARCRSAAARPKCPAQGTDHPRTGRPGPARPARPAGRGRSRWGALVTMASV